MNDTDTVHSLIPVGGSQTVLRGEESLPVDSEWELEANHPLCRECWVAAGSYHVVDAPVAPGHEIESASFRTVPVAGGLCYTDDQISDEYPSSFEWLHVTFVDPARVDGMRVEYDATIEHADGTVEEIKLRPPLAVTQDGPGVYVPLNQVEKGTPTITVMRLVSLDGVSGPDFELNIGASAMVLGCDCVKLTPRGASRLPLALLPAGIATFFSFRRRRRRMLAPI